jgi:hypothetical protein
VPMFRRGSGKAAIAFCARKSRISRGFAEKSIRTDEAVTVLWDLSRLKRPNRNPWSLKFCKPLKTGHILGSF